MLRPHPGLLTAAAVVAGLSGASALVEPLLGARPLLVVVVACVTGLVAVWTAREVTRGTTTVLAVGVVVPVPVAVLVARVLVAPLATVPLALQVASSVVAWAVLLGRRRLAVASALALPPLAAAGLVLGAGAWSVDEPTGPPTSASGRPGDGVDVALDTHAFLVQQGAAILAGDGRTAEAGFLRSGDPTAPVRPDGRHQTYLWRVQLGARDADRVLKATQMPDHFFNWWTHSGKGLIAGTSAATWAEQQFAAATRSWRAGDRPGAMYHLGAAVHLVDDACAPPHASPYVPDHRAFEEWVVAHQAEQAVTRGGIYRSDFRVDTGHGGREWSSAHTRGWVDECAHRAAELIVNTAQPPPDDPGGGTSYAATMAHFRDTQRLTAGYLAFFLDSVGGP